MTIDGSLRRFAITLGLACLVLPAGIGQERSGTSGDTCARMLTETPEEINFFDLRAEWARDPRYRPGLSTDRAFLAALERIGAAMQAQRFDQAIAICEAEYENFCASWVWNRQCQFAHSGAKRSEVAQRYSKLSFGLAQSVWAVGDGRTPETAYRVIDLYEEELIYQTQNVTKTGHSLLEKDGHRFDEITVVDPESGAERTIYFNVDAMFDAYDADAGRTPSAGE